MRITWAAGPGLARFLEGHPAIDEIVVVRRGLRGLLAARRDLAAREFDVALDPQGLAKSAWLAGTAKRSVGFDDPRERPARLFYDERVARPRGVHVIEENLALLRPLDVDSGPVEYGIPSMALRDDLAPLLSDRPLGLAPGGAWATKRWPLDRWIDLARSATTGPSRRPVVVVWGPDEQAQARAIAAAVPAARLLPPTSFRDLVAVFPRLAALVAVESGPLHLAAALGTPTLALVGPTDPVRNGALVTAASPNHRALVARPPCHPCYARTCANWICMPSLTSGAAIEEARRLLG